MQKRAWGMVSAEARRTFHAIQCGLHRNLCQCPRCHPVGNPSGRLSTHLAACGRTSQPLSCLFEFQLLLDRLQTHGWMLGERSSSRCSELAGVSLCPHAHSSKGAVCCESMRMQPCRAATSTFPPSPRPPTHRPYLDAWQQQLCTNRKLAGAGGGCCGRCLCLGECGFEGGRGAAGLC